MQDGNNGSWHCLIAGMICVKLWPSVVCHVVCADTAGGGGGGRLKVNIRSHTGQPPNAEVSYV